MGQVVEVKGSSTRFWVGQGVKGRNWRSRILTAAQDGSTVSIVVTAPCVLNRESPKAR